MYDDNDDNGDHDKQIDMEILDCFKAIHNHPNKKLICENWIYGEEFFLISERHKDGNAFYYKWNNIF